MVGDAEATSLRTALTGCPAGLGLVAGPGGQGLRPGTRPMTLSDTQSLILTAAAQRTDGLAAPPAKLPPAPRAAVARALLQAGLLAPIKAGAAFDPGLAWKLDGAPVVLGITEE